jgi:hypothetical protein
MRMGLPFRGVGVVVLSVFAGYAAGCAGGGSGGGGTLPTYADFDLASAKPRACDALTLSATSAEPLDQVTLSGLPADLGQIAVYLETVAGAIGHLYPTGPVAGGEATFTVPPSPDGDPDGGDVMLTVTNADEACPALAFTIDPLPPAPADYATYMADLSATMRELLDLVAQAFGTDYATLSAAAAPPAGGLAPLYVAVRVFDATLKSPPDLETDADRELMVRLLAKVGALGVLQGTIDDLDQWLTDNGSFKVAAGPVRKAGADVPSGSGTARRAGEGCTVKAPPEIDISSTARLSSIMSSSPFLDVASDALGDFATAMAAFSSLVGAVPGASATTSTYGGLATVVGSIVNYTRAVLPSAFTSLSFDVESPIWEDKYPTSSAWSNAQASVTSTPFNLAKAELENLVAVAELVSLPGWALTVAQFSYEDEFDAALDDITDADGPLCVTVPAQQWGPFDVTNGKWTSSEIIGDTIAKLTHETYLPAMLGASEIRVRILPDMFGGATNVASNFVTVEAKTVTISPVSPKVDKPGDPVHLVVSVNAYSPEAVTFTPPPGAGAVTHDYGGDGIHTYDFASPGSESQFPAPFRVASTSRVVPPTDFERADSVDIKLNKGTLEITGERGCIAPGEVVDLEAVLTGFDDPAGKTVTWDQSAGSTTPGIDTRMATYTAPGTLGLITVRAETPVPGAEDPAADEVEMEVSDSCLRQFFSVYMISSADGDPDCEGPLGSRTELGEEPDDEVVFPFDFTPEDFVLRSHVPEPDGAPYFDGAPLTLSTQSSFVESIPTGDACPTRTPFAHTDVNIEVPGSGRAHWDAHYEIRGTCLEMDFLNDCNVGGAGYFVKHYMYLPIEEPGTYQLTMDLACNLIPNFGGVHLTMSRYIDGEGFPQPPNASESPALPRNVTLDFACTGSPIRRTVTLDLVGPLGTTGTDLITVNYEGAPAGYLGGLTPEEMAENNAALDPMDKGPAPQFLQDMDVDVRLERLD